MEEAKTVRIFPCPHVEIKLHLTKEMIKDFKECMNIVDSSDYERYKSCDKCSWNRLEVEGLGICTYDDVYEKMAEVIQEEEHGRRGKGEEGKGRG